MKVSGFLRSGKMFSTYLNSSLSPSIRAVLRNNIQQKLRVKNCNSQRSLTSGNGVVVSSSEKVALDTAAKDLLENSVTYIVRHGHGDGVVTLNVGGKEFITLRSTLQTNPILWGHVLKAEANQEFIKGAVFIDRDATHFGLILQHLRNRADSIEHRLGDKIFPGKSSVTIQLPKDASARRDLFMESKYFQIKELEDLLCSYDVYTRIANFLNGGSNNPFFVISEAIRNGRRMLLATGGTGVFVGMLNEDLRKDISNIWRDIKKILNIENPVTEQQPAPAKSNFKPAMS